MEKQNPTPEQKVQLTEQGLADKTKVILENKETKDERIQIYELSQLGYDYKQIASLLKLKSPNVAGRTMRRYKKGIYKL